MRITKSLGVISVYAGKFLKETQPAATSITGRCGQVTSFRKEADQHLGSVVMELEKQLCCRLSG